MRNFVIISTRDDVDICQNIMNWIPDDENVVVYVKKSFENGEFHEKIRKTRENGKITVKFYEDDLRFRMSALRNYILKDMLDAKTGGFLHIIQENVKIHNPIANFVASVEKMMTVFALKSWFNTSCDVCNFIYQKYNPRLYISIDDEEAKKRYDQTIAWCSNANTLWTCYNMDICSFDDVKLDERFKCSMYYIIEFLARRRNTKKPGQLDYMNYYPSVPEEMNVFSIFETSDENPLTKGEMDEEGKIFQSMGIDTHPDMSVDQLMEDMYSAIMKIDPQE